MFFLGFKIALAGGRFFGFMLILIAVTYTTRPLRHPIAFSLSLEKIANSELVRSR